MTWKLGELGMVGFRRALALAVLGFFGTIYTLMTIGMEGPWMRPFLGLALCYGVAFFGVAAGWFWGRWFANGLGWSGVMLAAFGMAMMGWQPALAIYGGLHALVVAGLYGTNMAALFEGQADWRKRWQMGDPAVQRLGRAVTRAGASLPSLILWALAPREEPGRLLVLMVALLGLWGLLRLRTWGALAIGAAGAAALLMAGPWPVPANGVFWALEGTRAIAAAAPMTVVVPGLMLLAFLPFVVPVARFLGRER
ncbi:MAG TPA: hypothetical protein VKN99_17450 [Polyangia bacterium]|nr:hypothetical protein [Polyangia bacterium]